MHAEVFSGLEKSSVVTSPVQEMENANSKSNPTVVAVIGSVSLLRSYTGERKEWLHPIETGYSSHSYCPFFLFFRNQSKHSYA